MNECYQEPLNKEELNEYDNRTDIKYANTFNIKSSMFKSELFDKVNLRRMSRKFKHTERLRKFNLVINNDVNSQRPIFN